ncbi:MAG: hypothetical protein EKK53_12480 [Burkholderiales bacterium]|nr:MAG: hypothetical protein EKK53_12480 [Burkholderiales bacterium]
MVDGGWPWLAVAGAGALHGLHPATGWALLACTAAPRRALVPLALGHVGVVAGTAVAVRLAGPATLAIWPWACAALLAVALCGRQHRAGVAVWSGLVTALHGSGMMLVPALVPLCLGSAPARALTASGSIATALAACAVHLAAMLATTAVMACLAQRTRRWWISILGRYEYRARPCLRR